MAIEVLSVAKDLHLYGGQEKVLMDLHEGIKTDYNARVLGLVNYKKLHPKYKISSAEYVRLKNPWDLNNKIVIVHGRNMMSFLMVLKRVFFLNTKFIYVHHNVYDNLRALSFFPKDVISISGKVTQNLVNYFGVKENNIQLIYNGIKSAPDNSSITVPSKKDSIIILYAARVNSVKRQLEMVDRLTGKIDHKIKILFAGTGPDLEKLKERCQNSPNFKALGFVDNTHEIIDQADYLMLYSKQEGLPITLIEGAQHGKPLLINDVGGNIEIGIPGVNGILLNEGWETLANTLNGLCDIAEEEYLRMANNSKRRYEEMFTYDKMVNSYKHKIAQIAAN